MIPCVKIIAATMKQFQFKERAHLIDIFAQFKGERRKKDDLCNLYIDFGSYGSMP